MRRALAVIGAVVLVALAVAVRSALDDDGSGADDRSDGTTVVVCARDLMAACEALDGVEVRAERAADTAAAISGGDLPEDVDAWITTDAWVEVLASRAPGILGDSEAVAASPVVVAALPARAAAVTDLCADEAIWRCLGDNAGQAWGDLGGDSTWGPLRTGVPDAGAAVGLSVLASAAAGFFGDLDFASNDFGDLRGWLVDLSRASGGDDADPLGTMVIRAGSYSAAGATRAQVDTITRPVDRIDAAPTVTATVVAVRTRGGDGLPDLDPLQDALVDGGWTATAAEAPASTLKPGVMAALHTLWTEITR